MITRVVFAFILRKGANNSGVDRTHALDSESKPHLQGGLNSKKKGSSCQ